MDCKLFEEMMDRGKIIELEAELEGKKDELSKYQLGILYWVQKDKKKMTIEIFKDLIEKNFHKPYIYILLAENTFDYKERVNIIKCGVSLFPENEKLNRLLLEITTDSSEAEKIYKVLSIKNKLIDYDHLKVAELLYKEKEYNKVVELLEKINLNRQENRAANYIIILKNICYYYLGNNIKLKDIKKYTIGNLKDELGYIGFYLEIAHHIKNEELKKINELVINLPYDIFSDTFFEIFVNDGKSPCYFDFEEFFYEINDLILKLEKIEKKAKNKIETLKIIYKLQYSNEEIKLNKKEKTDFIKILKDELIENKEECLVEIYFDLLMKNKNEKEAINFIFEEYLYSFRYDKIINFENYSFSLITIKTIYSKIMSKDLRIEINKKEEYLIIILIKLLYSKREYSKVCKVFEKYDSMIHFNENSILFNIASSYFEIEKIKESKKIYLKILKYEKNNPAVLNNLGIIYEMEGEIDKALEYLKKAESINHDDIHVRNIKRCNTTLEEQKKYTEDIIEGKENIKKENFFIINKLVDFYNHKNDSGDIICSYSELPYFLNINSEKANEVLNTFLKKKYIFKRLEHPYNTNKSVYKINKIVEAEITIIKNNNKLINEIINKLSNISIDNMENMNLNEKFNKIESVNNKELANLLKRDYYELFMAYNMNNQKSVTLLSGSIIETILIYIIKENHPAIGNSLYELDITGLLNNCQNNHYITSVPLNFINGIKKYRNFVHPGVEIRENRKKIKIGDESTNLLWDFVNWLIDYAL